MAGAVVVRWLEGPPLAGARPGLVLAPASVLAQDAACGGIVGTGLVERAAGAARRHVKAVLGAGRSERPNPPLSAANKTNPPE
jgi:hypothetical protein